MVGREGGTSRVIEDTRGAMMDAIGGAIVVVCTTDDDK
jgi:hypothetical protein